jgi:hypothetical protein
LGKGTGRAKGARAVGAVKQSRVGERRQGSWGEKTEREGVGAFMEIDDAWDPHVVVGVEYGI